MTDDTIGADDRRRKRRAMCRLGPGALSLAVGAVLNFALFPQAAP